MITSVLGKGERALLVLLIAKYLSGSLRAVVRRNNLIMCLVFNSSIDVSRRCCWSTTNQFLPEMRGALLLLWLVLVLGMNLQYCNLLDQQKYIQRQQLPAWPSTCPKRIRLWRMRLMPVVGSPHDAFQLSLEHQAALLPCAALGHSRRDVACAPALL